MLKYQVVVYYKDESECNAQTDAHVWFQKEQSLSSVDHIKFQIHQ